MSERFLEMTRQADGSFLASFADDRPAARVSGWADIRRLRHRHNMTDHWAVDTDRAAFIAEFGHPYDDWWASLSPSCRESFMADPAGPVPARHAEELRRSLRHELGRDGLRAEGAFFSPEVRAYVVRRAADRRGQGDAS